jgi:hypothetical protein
MIKLKNILSESIGGLIVKLIALRMLWKIKVFRNLVKWFARRFTSGMFKGIGLKNKEVMIVIMEKAEAGKIKAGQKIAGIPVETYITKQAGMKEKFLELLNETATADTKAAAKVSGRGNIVSDAKGMQKTVKGYWYEIMGQNPANLDKLDDLWQDVLDRQLFNREWNFAMPGSDKIAKDELLELKNLWTTQTNPVKNWDKNYINPYSKRGKYISQMNTNEALAQYVIEKSDHNILDFMHQNFQKNRDDVSSFSSLRVFDSDAKDSYKWQAAQGQPK